MKKSVLVGVLLAAGVCSAVADQVRIDIPEINQYYTDYNYIVAYSTPAERRVLARQAAGMKLRDSLLDTAQLRILRGMVKGLLAAELDQDPGIVKGNRLAEDFLYSKIPVSVSRVAPGRIIVKTVRKPVRNWWQEGIAGMPNRSPGRFNPRAARELSYSETDYWVRVGGRWRVSSLHFYLVGT